jgi:3-isopropylmalate/(R)-2-methylmalate dehydratase large subunit
MSKTLIEKIISAHSGKNVKPGDSVDVHIDARLARDFGGANVVKNLRQHGLQIDEPSHTFFTFDCNPTGSDQKYAANQHACRLYAREQGIKVFDIDAGIGTHLAIERGLVGPGGTLVSTDSHANILGAIGAFGQGMGDVDVAQVFARGSVWFQVPPTVKIVFEGTPFPGACAKDIALAMLRECGAGGLLGYAAELEGAAIDKLDLAGRMTVASMATEMAGIIALIPPSPEVITFCENAGASFESVYADPDAHYEKTIRINIDKLPPLISRPGHPEDVIEVNEAAGKPVDSVFIGSCTNGRYEDLLAVAEVLKGKKVASGVVLKIVPATDSIWRQCMREEIFDIFKAAGALIGNAGCAGCASGQIGQNGPGEVTVSTGNRNFAGKQGKGSVYLASPRTAAACAVAGVITTAEGTSDLPAPAIRCSAPHVEKDHSSTSEAQPAQKCPTLIKGRAWIVNQDNIDTDMIFHNRHLAITDIDEMGQYTFGNLPGWEDFDSTVEAGDIVITGKNFGCGSSRQQAVDCFKSLGVTLIIAQSFGAIYQRNAINSAMPIIVAELVRRLVDGDVIEIDLASGAITLPDGSVIAGQPFSDVQMEIYHRGGLLQSTRGEK